MVLSCVLGSGYTRDSTKATLARRRARIAASVLILPKLREGLNCFTCRQKSTQRSAQLANESAAVGCLAVLAVQLAAGAAAMNTVCTDKPLSVPRQIRVWRPASSHACPSRRRKRVYATMPNAARR